MLEELVVMGERVRDDWEFPRVVSSRRKSTGAQQRPGGLGEVGQDWAESSRLWGASKEVGISSKGPGRPVRRC
jgi:hypothetical protein